MTVSSSHTPRLISLLSPFLGNAIHHFGFNLCLNVYDSWILPNYLQDIFMPENAQRMDTVMDGAKRQFPPFRGA